MTVDARVALERLRQAIDAGDLDAALQDLGVSVMGAFGRLRDTARFRELDLERMAQ